MPRTARPSRASNSDPVADPFGERLRRRYRRHYDLLGARIHFESNDRSALSLAEAVFGPSAARRGSLPRSELHISLRVDGRSSLRGSGPPPAPRFRAAAGVIVTTVDAANYAVVCPAQRTALICLSRDMLRHPYHARYELVEFAVYTLATRSLGLLPLHAACVGHKGRGLLLIGNSGAGKSTLALLAALHGMSVHAEDVAFIDLQHMQVYGVPRFLHLRGDTLRLVGDAALRRRLRASRIITRRGGARKLEVDLRQLQRVPAAPVTLAALVFLRAQRLPGHAQLRRLSSTGMRARLSRTQGFARSHMGWREFVRQSGHLPAYELGRDSLAATAVESLAQALHAQSPDAR